MSPAALTGRVKESGGDRNDVRTFGQVFAHVAEAQLGPYAAVNGVPNPNPGRKVQQTLKTKSEILKALADSFALCETVFSALTDANAMDFVKQGPDEIAKAAVLAGFLARGLNVRSGFGRAKNLLPPATERQTRGRAR